MVCSVDGCQSPALNKGLCKLHYQRLWRTGSVHVSRPCLHGTIEERFWRYVAKGEKSECWEWQGFRDKNGYGKIRSGKTNESSHRVSFRIHNGHLDKNMMVLHRCNNPACCNPSHLYQGNQTQNMKDRTDSGNAPVGESHPNCKFSEAVVQAVRMSSGPAAAVGAKYGMSATQVKNIRRGEQRSVQATKNHRSDEERATVAANTPKRVNTWGAKVAESQRKITSETAEVIKARLAAGEMVKDLAVEYGIHRTSLTKIKMGTYFVFGQKIQQKT